MEDANSGLQQPLLVEIEEEQKLKYLEFVQISVPHALMCAAKAYGYAKEKSGPLKPRIDTVEGTVKTVVGPVYQKYQGFPIELLKYVDRKFDESVNKVQSHVPTTLKEVSVRAFDKAQKAPAAASSVVEEVRKSGVVGTATELAKTTYTKYEPAVKGLYSKYEPVAEVYAVSAWHSLNKIPLFPQVAKAVGPTASYCSEKYNQSVQHAAEKGYKVASHLPLVPTERIAKALST